MSDALVFERSGAVGTLVLNRPDKRNAINLGLYQELPGCLRQIDEDSDVKVLVLRGAGRKAFSAGADISEFESVRASATDARAYNEHVAVAERALASLRKPTIAMVHGYCIGGGCGLATACDMRFADEAARLGITPAKLGLVYSLESTKRLVDLVGPSAAKYILMSGRQVPAGRAHQIGLVDEVHATEQLEDATREFASELAGRAQYSVRAVKEMVARIAAGQVADDEETTALRNNSFDTADYAEGVRAFLERRPPHFTWS
ncbi:MAG: enoyl-CoA hydratase/isomerase family protein [Streptosporangiales bacterium]